jgi:hypothetical protein
MATAKKPTKTKKTAEEAPKFEAEVLKLDSTQQPMWYPIDWETVKTVDDIKAILEHMGLGCSTDAPAYDSLKKYLFNRYIKITK